MKKKNQKGAKKVPATKTGEDVKSPKFGGWHLFLAVSLSQAGRK
jgi:hypothetical protein